MKVLLTAAPSLNLSNIDMEHINRRGYGLYPPISLTTIAATTLEIVDDVEIEILDLAYEIRTFLWHNNDTDISPDELMDKLLRDKLKEYEPDAVGISVVFSIGHSNAIKIANLVKSEISKCTVLCGGNHATFAYKRLLEDCPNIDVIMLNEADYTFPNFIRYLKGETKFEDLQGIAFRDKSTNKVRLAPTAPIIDDLDMLPIPRWDLLPNLKKYPLHGPIGPVYIYSDDYAPVYIMQTTRGCMAACKFCSVRDFYGKGIRGYSPERVLAEIDFMYNELKINHFEILDDDFTFDRKRTIQICDGLIKRNYKDLVWNIINGIRVGTITEEIMEKLVAAGCRLISIGIESGNETTLRLMRKPLTLKMLRQRKEIMDKYPEIYVKANWIVGFPNETEEETMNTFAFAEEMKFDWNVFSVYKPLPGTPLFQKMEDKEREQFNFGAIRNDFQFDAIRHIAAAYEKRSSSCQAKEENCWAAVIPDDYEISELSYRKNLEINFIKNPNLNGRNIDRAIRDFEGILRMIAKDHAIAHYCLAKAYHAKGDAKTSFEHISKVRNILSQPKYYKWVKHFEALVPEGELYDLFPV